MVDIEIKGLAELIEKMRAYPGRLRQEIEALMPAALTIFWENVPPYPPPPEGSTYRRTGTLGRTLGSGANAQSADIFEIRSLGSTMIEGRFGTRLKYARYVIGDRDTEQAGHMRHWWTLPQTVVERSTGKITRLFVNMVEDINAWLTRQSK
jgi:hypothetical protein